jgi:hypothetical protein
MPSLWGSRGLGQRNDFYERCIRPTPEGQERAFERFANLNQTAGEKAEKDTESLQFPLQFQDDRQ